MAKKKIEKRLWRNLLRTSTILKNILNQCEFLIFFDTETTGLRTDTDKIIQLSAIKTDKDLNIISRFDSYCNPYPMLISPKITEITGITPADVENAPLEKDVVTEFNEFTQNCGFVAYNSEFDYEMITNAFARAGIKREILHFDVREIAYDVAPNSSDFKLSTICSYLNINKEGEFHNSMFDVEMMYELFKKFYTQYINFTDTESCKPKAKVFALNPWSIGKNRRIYVPTSLGCFYYDIIKKHWGEKDTSFDAVNMSDIERQAIDMAQRKGYASLNKVKESVSYRDL